MTDNIILCFDGDNAGKEATTSAIEVLKEIGITPKVISLEENLDPDEYILKYGENAFKNKVENPDSSIEFLMKSHKSNKNLNDINDISKYIDESIDELLHIEDKIMVELTLKKISKEFDIKYEIINEKYNKKLETNNKVRVNKEPKIIIKEKYNKYKNASQNLLYYMIKDPKIINLVEKNITYFPDNNERMLSNEIIYYYHKYGIFNAADFISYLQEQNELLKLFNKIINLNLNEKYSKEEIEDYIKVINLYPINKKTEELSKQIKEETDPIKQAKILSEILSLKGVK